MCVGKSKILIKFDDWLVLINLENLEKNFNCFSCIAFITFFLHYSYVFKSFLHSIKTNHTKF